MVYSLKSTTNGARTFPSVLRRGGTLAPVNRARNSQLTTSPSHTEKIRHRKREREEGVQFVEIFWDAGDRGRALCTEEQSHHSLAVKLDDFSTAADVSIFVGTVGELHPERHTESGRCSLLQQRGIVFHHFRERDDEQRVGPEVHGGAVASEFFRETLVCRTGRDVDATKP